MKTNILKKIMHSTCRVVLVASSSLAMAKGNQVTVTVKHVGDFGESGDAYTFKATSGKNYQVYNAGGSSPIKGESLIEQSAKSKQKICLTLDADRSEPRLVQSVRKGPCP